MDLASLAASLTRLGAPIIGGALGGPAGAAIASTVVESLAKAFDVEATPEAVDAALEKPDAPIVVRRVEAAEAPAVMDQVNAYIRDVQDARATTIKLAEQGSPSANAPAILTGVNTLAFYGVLILLILYGLPDGGARELVSGMIGAVVGAYIASNNFWFGTSAGSKAKDATLADVAKARGRGK